MARAHVTRTLSQLAALAALASLLVVPALHGALGHVHTACDPSHAAGCELDAADASLDAARGGNVCPLCLASSQTRTLLVAGAAQGFAASDAPPRPLALPAVPAIPTPRARPVRGPRAPPVHA